MKACNLKQVEYKHFIAIARRADSLYEACRLEELAVAAAKQAGFEPQRLTDVKIQNVAGAANLRAWCMASSRSHSQDRQGPGPGEFQGHLGAVYPSREQENIQETINIFSGKAGAGGPGVRDHLTFSALGDSDDAEDLLDAQGGNVATKTAERVKELTRQDMVEFYKKHISLASPKGAKISVWMIAKATSNVSTKQVVEIFRALDLKNLGREAEAAVDMQDSSNAAEHDKAKEIEALKIFLLHDRKVLYPGTRWT
ncbi:hypothetical protein F5883DRAFT_723281 [Diaporthe sp. PMI_573]|nr:hypothetical protein F5883DRAFT_723281 [Diaporthaceae sp. PMI_573]